MSDLKTILNGILDGRSVDPATIGTLLELEDPIELKTLFEYADRVRRLYLGDGIYLRGLVEFSNVCNKECFYCGLNRMNARLTRYRMSPEEIMYSAAKVAGDGIRTVVLQSGEEPGLDAAWLAGIVRSIKEQFDIAVTLSAGERPYEDYRLWKEAGADRYLLKIETSQKVLYERFHDGASFENRLRCLRDLRDLGYEVGSGSLVGLPGQDTVSIARDLLFFKDQNYDMVGIGPFIPHPQTPLAHEKSAEASMVLKATAVARILLKDVNLPATTALGSLGRDYRPDGLRAGANVLMPNYTPAPYRALYTLYPGKRCLEESVGSCAGCMELTAKSINRTISHSKGGRRDAKYAA